MAVFNGTDADDSFEVGPNDYPGTANGRGGRDTLILRPSNTISLTTYLLNAGGFGTIYSGTTGLRTEFDYSGFEDVAIYYPGSTKLVRIDIGAPGTEQKLHLEASGVSVGGGARPTLEIDSTYRALTLDMGLSGPAGTGVSGSAGIQGTDISWSGFGKLIVRADLRSIYDGPATYDDHIVGGAYDDELYLGDGNNYAEGLGGNDKIVSGSAFYTTGTVPSTSTFYGGAGDDFLQSNGLNDRIDGGDGDDTWYGRYTFLYPSTPGVMNPPFIVTQGAGTDLNIGGGTVAITDIEHVVLAVPDYSEYNDVSIHDGFKSFSFVGSIYDFTDRLTIDWSMKTAAITGSATQQPLVQGLDPQMVGSLSDGSESVDFTLLDQLYVTFGSGDDSFDGSSFGNYSSNREILHGGLGNDTLLLGGFTSFVYGDDGNDILHAGTAVGGDGDDILSGGYLQGDAGDDIATAIDDPAEQNSISAWGGTGTDTLIIQGKFADFTIVARYVGEIFGDSPALDPNDRYALIIRLPGTSTQGEPYTIQETGFEYLQFDDVRYRFDGDANMYQGPDGYIIGDPILTEINAAPVFTSFNGQAVVNETIDEGIAAAATLTATDADADPIVFSIAGGTDANKFTIDAATGALAFKVAPDFTNPGDTDQDNVYHVVVKASDGLLSTTQELNLTIRESWTLNVSSMPFTEGDAGDVGQLVFRVQLNRPFATDVTIDYQADSYFPTASWAEPNVDFDTSPGTLTIPAGQTLGLIEIPVYGDDVYEYQGFEIFYLRMSNITPGVHLLYNDIVGQIDDNDPKPAPAWVEVDITDYRPVGYQGNGYPEGNSAIPIEVYRSNNLDTEFDVDYAITSTNAVLGQDYAASTNNPLTGTLHFAAGERSKYLSFQMLDDAVADGNKQIVVTLSNATNDTVIKDASDVTTLFDSDVAATVDVDIRDNTQPGYSGNGFPETNSAIPIAVRRTNASNTPFDVDYVIGSSDAVLGQDYAADTRNPLSGTVHFAADEDVKYLYFQMLDDDRVDGDKHIDISISNPTNGARITGASDRTTLFDNEVAAAIFVDIADFRPAAYSGNGYPEANSPISIEVRRYPDSNSPFDVDYAIGLGTAVLGLDYVADPRNPLSGTLHFAANESVKYLYVAMVDDEIVDGDKVLAVHLSNPTNGARISDGDDTTILFDNDKPATHLSGTSGDNSLSGGGAFEYFYLQQGGHDTVIGGGGSDGFYFGAALDTLDRVIGAPGGDDQVIIQGNYTGGNAISLTGPVFTDIDTLAIQPGNDARFGDASGALYSYNITVSDDIVAAGATLVVNANRLRVGENLTFDGSAETNGSFKFYAASGNDTLIGGAGNDQFYGRLGADTMTGGGGNDTFFYRAATESTTTSLDHITDFSAGDLIDLSFFDANTSNLPGTNDAFSFIGSAAFSAAGQLRVTDSGGGNWIVEGDINGDGVADLTIAVTTTGGHALVAADFVL